MAKKVLDAKELEKLDKEVKKIIEPIREARLEHYMITKAKSVVIFVAVFIMLIGLLLQLLSKSETVQLIGVGIIVAMAIVMVAGFLSVKIKTPLSFASYWFLDKDGNEGCLQVMSQKWIVFSWKDLIIEYRDGRISRLSERFMPDFEWKRFKNATFTSSGEYDKNSRWYQGVLDEDGKQTKVRLTIKKGELDFIECGRDRVRYMSPVLTRFTIMLPAPLYMVIEESKMRLRPGSNFVFKKLIEKN